MRLTPPSRLALLAATCAGVALPAGAAHAAAREPAEVPGRYIVVYGDGVRQPSAKTDRLERAAGFRSRLRYRHALDGFAARLTDRQVAELRAHPDVEHVTADRLVRASGTVPLAAGETVPTGVSRTEAATATTARQASTAAVAVLDSGVDLDHPDLDAVDGRNCVSAGASADDDNGHGTHVAGSIGARNDGSGVVGVAPGTKVVAVKVLDGTGSGSWSQVICGIDWVTSTRTDADPGNDVAVANMSLGGPGDPVGTCSTTGDPMHRAICASTAAGVTYVVAAGNDGWDFDYAPAPDTPAAYPEVLTVTAVSDSDGAPGGTGGAPACQTAEGDDRYASFSNFAATGAGQAHAIAAPGVCIRSTVPGGGWGTLSGTSMAAPHVAGAVALCLGEAGATGPCTGLTPAQVVARMRADADAHTRAVPAFGFGGDPLQPVSGRYYGFLNWSETQAATTAGTFFPNATTLVTGVVRSGGAAQLGADDDAHYAVGSTASGTRTAAWYGTLTGVPNAARTLKVAYKGKSSAACRQTVAIWRWTTSSWVQLDSRGVGSTEALVERSPSGSPADYVGDATGLGEVRVRVRCANSSRAFTLSGDLLRITAT